MEINTDTSPRPKCPVLAKLEVDLDKEKGFPTVLWSKGEKVVDLHLKLNGKKSSDDKFIEFASIGRIKNEKEELDQKESDLFLDGSSYVKWEARNFNKVPVESNDRDIDKDVMEPHAIKKEADEVAAEELLNYSHENPSKSEFIKREELHIKDEKDFDDRLNKKIPKSRKSAAVLHQCLECPYRTIRKADLKSHSIKHKKGDEIDWYSCQECPYKTFRKENFKRHVQIHNSNDLLLKCSKCSYESYSGTNFKRHQLKHNDNVQWLHCPECSYKTLLHTNFRHHLLKHNTICDVFKCPNCPYQTERKDRLTVHQAKHESMDKWHSCPLCSYKTYDKRTLQIHCLRRHDIHPNKRKQIEIFKCTECSYKRVHNLDMKKHQLIHDQSSWLHCPDCAYKTHYKCNLQRHQVRHQEESGEGWHRCLKCSYKTPHQQDLRRHVMSRHVTSSDKFLRFECLQCNFKTTHKDYLRTHQLRHKEAHEIKWFCCYECSFKTKLKASLVRHITLKHKKD